MILLSLATAYFLSSNLQRAISEPILELARAAFAVSLHKNYSIRAAKRSKDEIGFPFDRFNEMMGRIQQHERALQLVQAAWKRGSTSALANCRRKLRTGRGPSAIWLSAPSS